MKGQYLNLEQQALKFEPDEEDWDPAYNGGVGGAVY